MTEAEQIEVLTDAQVTLLADRRSRGPYGLAGGADGLPGRTLVIGLDGSDPPGRRRFLRLEICLWL